MTISTVVEMQEVKENIEDKKLEVHQIVLDHEAARNVVERDKTKFFAKLGFFRPKHGEIEVESVRLFYEPYMVAKANYLLDYYKKKTYTVKIDDEVFEVIAFGETFKPETVKEGKILKRPHKAISFETQERVIHKAATHLALNRTGREISLLRLPDGPTEPEPEKVLKKDSEKVRELKVPPELILDIIRSRTAKRPPDAGRIVEEVFEVTEYMLVCTPIYEARCRQLKTGEIKIIPISGVTGKLLSL